VEGENSTSGPQPYQPYEAEVTNSPISNKCSSDARYGRYSKLSSSGVPLNANSVHQCPNAGSYARTYQGHMTHCS